MIFQYEFEYTNGKIVIREFNSKTDAVFYAHNEGDHLYNYKLLFADDNPLQVRSL